MPTIILSLSALNVPCLYRPEFTRHSNKSRP
jgi:hypothetical protein